MVGPHCGASGCKNGYCFKNADIPTTTTTTIVDNRLVREASCIGPRASGAHGKDGIALNYTDKHTKTHFSLVYQLSNQYRCARSQL